MNCPKCERLMVLADVDRQEKKFVCIVCDIGIKLTVEAVKTPSQGADEAIVASAKQYAKDKTDKSDAHKPAQNVTVQSKRK